MPGAAVPPRRLPSAGDSRRTAAHLLQKDLALVLLGAGCGANAVDSAGQTALIKVLMAFNPKKDLIGLLLKHGADADAK